MYVPGVVGVPEIVVSAGAPLAAIARPGGSAPALTFQAMPLPSLPTTETGAA